MFYLSRVFVIVVVVHCLTDVPHFPSTVRVDLITVHAIAWNEKKFTGLHDTLCARYVKVSLSCKRFYWYFYFLLLLCDLSWYHYRLARCLWWRERSLKSRKQN